MEKFDVFISYSRNDEVAKDKIADIFRKNGISFCYDKEILLPGHSYFEDIKTYILRSKVVLVIYSEWALNSEWIKSESDFAKNNNIPIIEVLTDNPNGLNGVRRMLFGTKLEMNAIRFEERLLSSVLNNGVNPETTTIYSDYIALREKALQRGDSKKERDAFIGLLRLAELGNKMATSCITGEAWNIDLLEAVVNYIPINSYFIEDLRSDLYKKGEIIAEDGTLFDVPQRGRGMEQAAFCMMKRAIDLGFRGVNPLNYCWAFIGEDDFENCLNRLGNSSRLHLTKDLEQRNKTFQQDKTTKESSLKDYPIFISYKRNDKELVFPIKDRIETSVGRKCWIDLDGIESDAQFANVIIKAINSAKIFLFMYSHTHTEIEDYDNDWTVREIRFAQKKKKRIVFLNIDGSQLSDWFELFFGGKQQIDTSSPMAMERLYRDIKKWLD